MDEELSNCKVTAESALWALVQMACLAAILPIDMDTLSIEQDGIPDSERSE
jgi:hypothetical protein